MTTMSWTLSVLFFQMSWIRRSPFYSAAYEFFFDDGSINRAGCAFGLCMARPAKMRGLSHTCVGVKYSRPGMIPCHGDYCDAPWLGRPFFNRRNGIWIRRRCSRCKIWGGLGVLGHIAGKGHITIPAHLFPSYLMLTASPSSMPLFFVARHIRCATWTRATTRVSARASSDRCALWFLTPLPSLIHSAWYAYLRSFSPLCAATRYPMITQDVIYFSGGIFVGSLRSRPACFTGSWVTPCPRVLSPTPWKRSGMNVSLRATSTGPKASHICGVTHCMNTHSCWSNLCIPELADCGCLRATSESVLTNCTHHCTFSSIQVASDSCSPMNPSR